MCPTLGLVLGDMPICHVCRSTTVDEGQTIHLSSLKVFIGKCHNILWFVTLGCRSGVGFKVFRITANGETTFILDLKQFAILAGLPSFVPISIDAGIAVGMNVCIPPLFSGIAANVLSDFSRLG